MDLRSLNKNEKKILTEAMNCGAQKLTVTAIAKKVGVKPEYVVEKLKKPEFRQLFVESMQDGIVAEAPAILHSFVNAAKEGSFQHGKLILELAGVHQENQRIDLHAKMEVEQSLFKSDDERRDFLKATLAEIREKQDQDDQDNQDKGEI